jgi:MFS family permease
MFCLLLSDYMSRQALNALFPLLKAQWQLSDTQLGSMSGIVPVMVGVLTLPFSILADRWGRVRGIALMVAVWSVATAGCALAGTYHQMFVARLFVGVGEAAYGSVGFAVLLSVFPRHMRSTVAGGFTSAGAFGSVLGVSLSGVIATHFGWRWSMGVMAIVGLVLLIIYCAVVTETKVASAQQDNAYRTAMAANAKLTAGAFLAGLFPSRSVFCAYLGGASQVFIQGTLLVWLPSYLNRYWGMPISKAAVAAAGLVLVSGFGQLLCGLITDRICGNSVLKRWNMAIGYCLVLGTLLTIAFRLPHGDLQLALLVPGVFFLGTSFTTCNPIIADGTLPAIHSSVFATSTLFNNLLGLAAGPIVTGMVADAASLEVAIRWLPLAAVLPCTVFVIGRWCHVAERRRDVVSDDRYPLRRA